MSIKSAAEVSTTLTRRTEFAFKMRAVQRRDNSYHETDWDKAIPVTVVAATKQEAIDKAGGALGEAGSNRHWVFRVASVKDMLLPPEDVTS